MVVQAALAIKRTFHAVYELWGFSKTKINCKDLFLINQWKLHLGSQQISKTIKKEKKKENSTKTTIESDLGMLGIELFGNGGLAVAVHLSLRCPSFQFEMKNKK